jgi:hypothetical protein
MAFNKAVLVTDLKAILKKPSTSNNVDTVAQELADAIDKYVKTGKATGVDSRGDTHNLILL